MHILFLSDLHLGSFLFRSENIILSLLDNKYDKIFLLGDIIDKWAGNINDILIRYNKIIKKINSLDNIIIIKGNHDPEFNILKEIFFNVNVTNKHIEDDFIVIHGHEWDNTLRIGRIFFSIHKFLEKFNFNFKGFIRNIIYSFLSFFQGSDKNKDIVSNIEKDIVKNCIRYNNVIIAGHTHMPKIVKEKDFMYINTGDWIYNRSYVEYIDGEFKLYNLNR
jgi:UDP-2,3-diacylglucosamine pyrophosphatase LpxH